MNKAELIQSIRFAVISDIMKKHNRMLVPVAWSNKHVHLSQADSDVLFGKNYQFTPIKALSQPGQFACKETISIMGPKNKSENLRVLGPFRKETQVELAITDCFRLGVNPVVRHSGDIFGTPGGVLIGPAGKVELDKGVIVSARHLHLSDTQAALFGLKDGDIVNLKTNGFRKMIFENVLVRAGKDHEMEVHLDIDEINACMLSNGDFAEVIRQTGNVMQPVTSENNSTQITPAPEAGIPEIHNLVTENDVLKAFKTGNNTIYLKNRAIITPLAKDTASDKGITLIRVKES